MIERVADVAGRRGVLSDGLSVSPPRRDRCSA